MTFSVAIAESNPLVLAGLAEKLENDQRFTLVSTTGKAEDFVGMVIRVPVDIGIIDWDIPVMGGKRLIELLRDQTNSPRIVAYGSNNRSIIQHAMQAGAAAFCARDSSGEELIEICDAVGQGKMIFPFTDLRDIEHNPLSTLTQRELDLLDALTTGATNTQLADQFNISENTIKFHLSNIYSKLDARNRAKAVAMYLSLRNEFYTVKPD